MSVEQIPTKPSMGRSIITHDPASRFFPARGFLMQDAVPRKNKTWRRGVAYNQGPTSSCVGQTLKGMLNTGPFSGQVSYSRRSRYDALDFYRNGQSYDQWPGAEPEYYGTSALGVCKHLQGQGIISEYRWCFGVDDVIDTLVQHGPVGIGIWWYSGMFTTDVQGFIRPVGRKEGGHEVELHGVNVDDEYVIGTNSWGRSWGAGGRFKLSWEHLDQLLEDDGDAVTLVKLGGA